MKDSRALMFVVIALLAIALLVTIPVTIAHADDEQPAVAQTETETTEQEGPPAEQTPPETTESKTEQEAETPEESQKDWKDEAISFLQEKILPYAISILLSVGTLYMYLRPVLLMVKDTVKTGKIQQEKFGEYKAESDQKLQELTEQLEEAKQQLTEQFDESKKQLTEAEEKLAAATDLLKDYEQQVTVLKEEIETLANMVTLGFANSAELVRKGAAKKICELAEPIRKRGAKNET